MDIEYIIIGTIFLLTGIAIIIYKFRYHTIKEETSFSNYDIKGAIILILVALYLLWKEIEKII